MKKKYGQLFLWHCIFYLVYYTAREVFINKSFGAPEEWTNFDLVYMELTAFFSFFIYSIGAYWVIFHYHNRALLQRIALLLLVTVVAIGVRYLLQEVVAPYFWGFRNYREGYGLLNYYLDNLYFAVLHGSIGFVFFYLQFSRYT
ncbi:MAG: hypothetical protein AAFP82_22345, partial [Bacteroidota bacterium]